MKKLRYILALVLFAHLSPNLYGAAGFGCDGVAGGVIFKNTLYGGGTGLLLGGIYVASQDDQEDSGKTIANATLIGSTLGIILGITEVATRDCHEPSRRANNRFNVSPMISLSKTKLHGVSLSWAID